ncbi:MAG TPA: polysaccharide deacetylase family protein [Rubricoccaceae bacterium]|nr:polysaccharide deacetylase family protein [Rubricoccaceae bacterium]
MPRAFFLLIAAVTFASAACAQPESSAVAPPARAVALTFDDLPLNAGPEALGCDADALLAMHDRLLAHLAAYEAPAAGLVNEGRACDRLPAGTLETILTRWLDAGHTLGNHTYSHPDLVTSSVEDYTADIVRGEAITRRLLEARGQRLRYFRHPDLRTGDTEEKKAAVEAFLQERGYTIAPVTIDSDEWVFAAAYARAFARGDSTTARRIRAEYLTWSEAVVEHFEGWSREVVGYELPQIALLHANLLHADAAGDLFAMYARRGYRFVTLDEALRDPAYARPDPYVGRYGNSWLHRWARGVGREVRWEPDAPDWVVAYYRAED